MPVEASLAAIAPPSPHRAMEERTLADESVVVTFWTMVSRVTGVGRLAAIAAVLGATYMGNTFQAANLLPNAVFEFLTGSLLVNVLVPPLVQSARRGNARAVERVAGGFLGLATLGLGLAVAALILARPLLLGGFTAGVDDPTVAAAQHHVGSLLLLLVLPQVVLYGYAGTASAVLTASGRFALPAAAPALENVGTMASVVAGGVMFGTGVGVEHAPGALVLVLGGGATAAVALHAGVLWVGCRRAGIALRPRLGWFDPDVRRVIADVIPTIGQAGLNALRTLVALVAGNAVPGGVVAFQLALTFFYLPPALSARAVGVAMLRRLSILHQDGDRNVFAGELGRGVALTIFLTVPAAVGYMVLARPLVRAVSFGEMVSGPGIGLAAAALIALAPGVLGEGGFLLGSYAAYAVGDVRSPFRSVLIRTAVAVGGMLVATVVLDGAALLFALGLSISVANAAGTMHLARRLARSIPRPASIAGPLLRSAAASLAMACASVPTYAALTGVITSAHAPTFAVIVAGALGGAAYLFVQHLLRSPEQSAFVESIRSALGRTSQTATAVA